MQKNVLTTDKKDFITFIAILVSPHYLGMVFIGDAVKKCHSDHRHTIEILRRFFGEYDLESTLEYFKSKGGYCDCEVFLNVYRSYVNLPMYLGVHTK